MLSDEAVQVHDEIVKGIGLIAEVQAEVNNSLVGLIHDVSGMLIKAVGEVIVKVSRIDEAINIMLNGIGVEGGTSGAGVSEGTRDLIGAEWGAAVVGALEEDTTVAFEAAMIDITHRFRRDDSSGA